MLKLRGLATGVGSLPHKDAGSALDLIFKYTPNIPFWPQLSKRDIREGMIAQFSENLPCLKITPEGLIYNCANQEKELEAFYERIIANDIDHFKISPDFSSGIAEFYRRLEKANLKNIDFIKCQVTGPFTFGASINDERGVALLHEPLIMQAIYKGLAAKALWQIRHLKKFGKKIILFIDEPYLANLGSAYTAINSRDVIKGLSELADAIKSEEVLLGIHCCGNADWSAIIGLKQIDIISFDAADFLDKFLLYAPDLKGFLERGGIVCWGIVPTQGFSGKENADSLADRLMQGIDALAKKGLDRDLLLERLLISPACGLGALDVAGAEKIFQVLSETSSLLRKSACF
jgi:methionine synthase II (cobalamin-independent)